MSYGEIPAGEPVAKKETEIFVHRAGWVVDGEPNSLKNATEVFAKGVSGCEVDLRVTSDGALVVTHENVKAKTKDEFLRDNPNHMTMESWVDWLSGPEMSGKSLYLDLKDGDIDPFKLVEMTKALGDRIVIGTKNPEVAVKAMLARKLLSSESRVILQIPDPLIPSVAVEYAKNAAKNAGLTELPFGVSASDLVPDGVHFYFPENFAKDVAGEMKGNGEFVPMTDKTKPEAAKRFPNIFGFHDLQRARLKAFTQEAKAAGFKYVFAGSAESAQTNQRMIEWGVDAIMPNNPDVLPESLKVEVPVGGITIPEPASRDKSTMQMREGNLAQEFATVQDKSVADMSEQESKRRIYLETAQKLKGVGALRAQLGF